MRLAAEYTSACNFFIGSPVKELSSCGERYENRIDFLRGKLSALERHCRDTGRPCVDSEKTAQTYVKVTSNAQGVTEVTDLCHEFVKLGLQQSSLTF